MIAIRPVLMAHVVLYPMSLEWMKNGHDAVSGV